MIYTEFLFSSLPVDEARDPPRSGSTTWITSARTSGMSVLPLNTSRSPIDLVHEANPGGWL